MTSDHFHIAPEQVTQREENRLEIRFTDLKLLNKMKTLTYLWGETPIREYLGAPIYSDNEFKLPAPPFIYQLRKIKMN